MTAVVLQALSNYSMLKRGRRPLLERALVIGVRRLRRFSQNAITSLPSGLSVDA